MGVLYHKLTEDIRFREGLKACISCGTCTAICPAAQYTDYDPRNIVELVQRRDENILVHLLKDDMIWRCGECLSCKTRCPRDNTPAYLIQALRSLSLDTGFYRYSEQGRKQVEIKRGVGENILKYGYCVFIDEITVGQHPEQGPVWDWYRKNRASILLRLGANYNGTGSGTLRKIQESDLADLRAIFVETGALKRFEDIENAEL